MDARSADRLPPDVLRAALDAAARDAVRPAALGLAGLFATFAVAHVLLLPPATAPAMSLLATATAVAFAILFLVVRRDGLPAAGAHAVTGAGALLVLANSAAHQWLLPEARLTTNQILLLLGCGYFMLSRAWLLVLQVATVASWGAIVVHTGVWDAAWEHFGMALLSACVLGAIVQAARIRTIGRLERLRRRDAALRAQLEEATRAAQAGERAKSEFLATMSHEIRTPMNGVIGFLDMLADTPLDGEQREYVGTVRRCADTLLGLLNDVLDFSRLEAGKVRLEAIPFDARLVLEEVVDLLALGAEQKDLALVLAWPADVPRHVVGDPARFRQIAINLAGNAVKFTDRGHVRLAVETAPAAPGHVRLRLRVEDTGIGIPADRLPLLFDKFTQADASTTRRFGGTGLGLAIVRQLVELMAGTVRVESAAGAGSTFVVELDLPRQEADASAPPLRATLPVLVLSPSDVVRDALVLQLGGLGMTAVPVATLDDACARAAETPSLCIVDHRPPALDATPAAERLVPLTGARCVILVPCGTRRLPGVPDAATQVTRPLRTARLVEALGAALAADAPAPGSRRAAS